MQCPFSGKANMFCNCKSNEQKARKNLVLTHIKKGKLT